MRSTMKSSMKIKISGVWAIVCAACVVVCSGAAMADAAVKDYAPYPQPDNGYVTDIAHLLTAEQEKKLESWLYDCEKENGFEMAIVTIGSIADYPGTDNGSIESFATGLFDRYGIGNMPKNDGVLLLVAVKDREARIELGAGYPSSRDKDADRIMKNVIVPQFKNGHYGSGIFNGAKSILRTFAGKDVTAGQTMPLPQNAAAAHQAQRTQNAPPVPTRTTSHSYTPRPSQYGHPIHRPSGFGGAGLIIGLFIVGFVVMVILMFRRMMNGSISGGYGTCNGVIGQDDSGIVPDDGYNRGFLSGLFMGGSRFGHQGLHNGGIHFGGRSSHNHGIGFGSGHSSGGFGRSFGGGFGGGFSGGSSHSSFGGGFSGGGGATGKW